jgi:hypothetical protein
VGVLRAEATREPVWLEVASVRDMIVSADSRRTL